MSQECSIGRLDEGYHPEGDATIPQMWQGPGKRGNRTCGIGSGKFRRSEYPANRSRPFSITYAYS